MKYYIIIPAHNEADFIALTLESLVSQTVVPSKVVVVNDNSTDETAAIVEGFIKYNPRYFRMLTILLNNFPAIICGTII